jgi:hypothetical protein
MSSSPPEAERECDDEVHGAVNVAGAFTAGTHHAAACGPPPGARRAGAEQSPSRDVSHDRAAPGRGGAQRR